MSFFSDVIVATLLLLLPSPAQTGQAPPMMQTEQDLGDFMGGGMGQEVRENILHYFIQTVYCCVSKGEYGECFLCPCTGAGGIIGPICSPFSNGRFHYRARMYQVHPSLLPFACRLCAPTERQVLASHYGKGLAGYVCGGATGTCL